MINSKYDTLTFILEKAKYSLLNSKDRKLELFIAVNTISHEANNIETKYNKDNKCIEWNVNELFKMSNEEVVDTLSKIISNNVDLSLVMDKFTMDMSALDQSKLEEENIEDYYNRSDDYTKVLIAASAAVRIKNRCKWADESVHNKLHEDTVTSFYAGFLYNLPVSVIKFSVSQYIGIETIIIEDMDKNKSLDALIDKVGNFESSNFQESKEDTELSEEDQEKVNRLINKRKEQLDIYDELTKVHGDVSDISDDMNTFVLDTWETIKPDESRHCNLINYIRSCGVCVGKVIMKIGNVKYPDFYFNEEEEGITETSVIGSDKKYFYEYKKQYSFSELIPADSAEEAMDRCYKRLIEFGYLSA